MKELGEFLKKTRISNGVSVTEACEDLDFSTSHLENIESGNIRAFKDVYELRTMVKSYAKYLGLDPEKIVDEFNGFLFQHTSKISLDDIAAAQNKTENEKKVKSPYTKEYKKEIKKWPFFCMAFAILLFIVLLYLILSFFNKAPDRINELKGIKEVNYFEYSN